MRKLFLIVIVLISTMAFTAPIASAQTTLSAGCTTTAGSTGTVPDTITDTYTAGEVISVTVTSADGAVFDVTIAGNLLLDDAATGASTSYTVQADGSVTINMTLTGGTGTYETDCTADGETDGFDGTLCHRPPGNPDAAHTITVGSQNAVETHISKHGDTMGACPDGVQTRSDNFDVNITIFVIFASDTIQVYGECTDICEEVLNVPIVLIIDFNLVVININTGDDSDDTGEFIDVENPEDFGFILGEVTSDGLYVVIYYLHPDPDNPGVGVFQINVYDTGTLIDDSILVFIDSSGDIILWTDHSVWDSDDS